MGNTILMNTFRLNMRGLWKCQSRYVGRMYANQYWVRYGTTRKTPVGCRKWNVYISRAARQPEKIDVRCRWCDRRVKFQPIRQSQRGDWRPVKFVELSLLSKEELVKKMVQLNAKIGRKNSYFFENRRRE